MPKTTFFLLALAVMVALCAPANAGKQCRNGTDLAIPPPLTTSPPRARV
jgi:hypothetical protein